MKRLFITILALLGAFSSFGQGYNLCEGWTQNLGQNGLSAPAKAMASDNARNRVYVGGSSRFGGIPSIYTFAWLDTETHRWHEVGMFQCTSCGGGTVNALVLDDSGHVYIGGLFEGVLDAQGNLIASKNVIRYNPYTDTFEPLALGLEANTVYALDWNNDTLIAGGRITFVKNLSGDQPVNNVALFDEASQTWHAMGQGIGSHNLSTDDNGDVYALEYDIHGNLYVGGRFSKINANDTVFSVAKWSPQTGWEDMQDRLFLAYNQQSAKYPPLINDLAFSPITGRLYATGYLGYTFGGNNILAAYDGSTWDFVGEGKPASTGAIYYGQTLHLDAGIGHLYVGGNFNTFNDDLSNPAPGNYIAYYDDSFRGWGNLGDAITKAAAGPEVSAITSFSNINDYGVYVSGNFTEANHFPVNFIAKATFQFSGVAEFREGVGRGAHGMCDVVNDVCYFPFNDEVLIGGSFSKFNKTYAQGLVAFKDTGFARMGHSSFTRDIFPPEIHDIFVGESNQLYVGGIFDSVRQDYLGGSISRFSPGVARYQPFLGLWVPIVNSLGGSKTVYAISQLEGELLIGGNFDAVGGITARGLAIQDTANNSWQEFANIGGGYVRDILVMHDSLVYIGGTFSSINGQNIAGVAVYDGSSWSGLGQNFGFYNDVFALAWDSLKNELIVGGSFDNVYQSNGNSLASDGLAFWDGTNWSTRGSLSAIFTNPSQYAPIVRSIASQGNGEILIGGEFSGVGGVNANRVAHWIPGAGWQSLLDDGISENPCNQSQNPSVNALAVIPGKNRLYLGGNFNQSGLEQAGKFASYGLGRTGKNTIIDSLLSVCSDHYLFADSSFSDIRWSTGDTGPLLSLPILFMDVPEKWVSVTAQRNGCLYADSILLKVGDNMNVYPYTSRKWKVDSLNRKVSMFYTRKPNYVDSVHIDFGDGTQVSYGPAQGALPDTISHIYSSPGSFKVTHSTISVCESNRRDTTFVFGTTGIRPENQLSFDLFPNPNTGQFKLQYQAKEPGAAIRIEVMDMMGKSLWTQELKQHEIAQGYRMNFGDLSAGTYLLKLTNGYRQGTQLLLIE